MTHRMHQRVKMRQWCEWGFMLQHTWINGPGVESFKLKCVVCSVVFLFVRNMNPAERKLWHRGSAPLQKERNNSHAFKFWGEKNGFQCTPLKLSRSRTAQLWVTTTTHSGSSNKSEIFWNLHFFICLPFSQGQTNLRHQGVLKFRDRTLIKASEFQGKL